MPAQLLNTMYSQAGLAGRKGESQHQRCLACCGVIQSDSGSRRKTEGGWLFGIGLTDSRSQCHAAYWSLCQTAGNLVGLWCGQEVEVLAASWLLGNLNLNSCFLYFEHTQCQRWSSQLLEPCIKPVLIPHQQNWNSSLLQLPKKLYG